MYISFLYRDIKRQIDFIRPNPIQTVFFSMVILRGLRLQIISKNVSPHLRGPPSVWYRQDRLLESSNLFLFSFLHLRLSPLFLSLFPQFFSFTFNFFLLLSFSQFPTSFNFSPIRVENKYSFLSLFLFFWK